MYNKETFFSIIIPVYNGLSHDLPLCLNSIWQQSLNEDLYEVICVDDCSTDRSQEWIKDEMPKHNNLKLIKNEKNIRQGGARNNGVKHSKGKYILFIDQDDYYENSALNIIYQHLIDTTPELDIFVSDSAFQFKGHETKKLQLNLPCKDVLSGEEFLIKNGPALAPWRLCIKKEHLIKNELWFVENCRIEDIDWACKVMFHAKRVQYLPILLVHYIKSDSSQTDNMYKNMEILRDNTLAANRTLEVANDLYQNSIAKQCILNIVDNHYNFTCKYLFGMWKSLKEKEIIVHLIQQKQSKYQLVKLAIEHPRLFCAVSNFGVPAFRMARYIKRKWRAINDK